MKREGVGEAVGRVSLRVGNTDFLRLYAGHIGYDVAEAHRGNRFAARAVALLVPLARRHGLEELWITCNPENTASWRTCEILGAEYVETVPTPEDTEMFKRGSTHKRRYRLVVPQTIGEHDPTTALP
jgi:tagatose 1,6-diphosphate aldolase